MKQVFFGFIVFFISIYFSFSSSYSDSIIYLRSIDSISLDPGKTEDFYSSEVIANMFEGLVRYKKGFYEIEPCLAYKWDIKDNGKSWIFYLRKNVMFHNGTKFDAHSVVSTFKRRLGKSKSLKRLWFFFPYIKSVELVNKFTVKFSLRKPYAPLLSALTDPTAFIVAPESYKGETFIPIGTGPFKFDHWEKGKFLVINRNDQYWNGRVPISKVIFKVIKNSTTKTLQIKNGNADLTRIESAFELEEFMGLKDIKILKNSSMVVRYLAFNTRNYPLNKVEVRKAMAHLINKKSLVKHIFQNTAIAAVTPIPPDLFGFNKNIKDYDYDLQKSKALLKKVGLSEGFTCKLYFFDQNLDIRKISNIFASNAKKVNITIKKMPLPFKELMKRCDEGEHDLGIFGWIGAPDPDFFLFPLFTMTQGNKNRAFYQNKQLTKLLEKARATLNRAERIKYYKKAQEIIYQDMPWIPLYHTKSIIAYRKDLKNLYVIPNDYLVFRYAIKKTDIN